MMRTDLFRKLDHRLCFMALCLLMVLFLSGFTIDVRAATDDPQTGVSFWSEHADALKWVVWALFGYLVWSVKRTLEKVEENFGTMDKRMRQVEEKLTEISAEHEVIMKTGGH